jgi:hypothetical protein
MIRSIPPIFETIFCFNRDECLKRDAIKSGSKDPIIDEDPRKPRKPVSPEERKIFDKIKQIEELQKMHESRKKVEK